MAEQENKEVKEVKAAADPKDTPRAEASRENAREGGREKWGRGRDRGER